MQRTQKLNRFPSNQTQPRYHLANANYFVSIAAFAVGIFCYCLQLFNNPVIVEDVIRSSNDCIVLNDYRQCLQFYTYREMIGGIETSTHACRVENSKLQGLFDEENRRETYLLPHRHHIALSEGCVVVLVGFREESIPISFISQSPCNIITMNPSEAAIYSSKLILPSFLRHNSVVDVMMVDISPSPYLLLSQLYLNPQNSATVTIICQLSIVFYHHDGNHREFGVSILRILAYGKYVPLRCEFVGDDLHLLFVNYDEPVCIDRFLIDICSNI